MHRRDFLRASVAAAAACVSDPVWAVAAHPDVSIRKVTCGPRHHWFGYYDKLQFSPDGRYLLGMAVDFEHRSPTEDDPITIGMIDLQEADRWIELGQSRSWCWQQGCMLQWIPGSSTEVIWNDLAQDGFVARIKDVKTGRERTVPHAVYCLSSDGKTAFAPDFRRINDLRPGYGYPGFADPYADLSAPQQSGIVRIDLSNGKVTPILSIADIARIGPMPASSIGMQHYFNHLLCSPDGSRFIALHRWRYPDGSRLTRMITADNEGKDVRIVCGNGYTSHFIWRDSKHILAQSRGFNDHDNWGNFLFEDVDGGGDIQEIGRGVLDGAGHLSYLPGNEWILNDTYPKGPERLQTPHLYHVRRGERIDLARFPLPPRYKGEWRVDTHPRFSPDGTTVCVDTPTVEEGRQMYLLDISKIVG